MKISNSARHPRFIPPAVSLAVALSLSACSTPNADSESGQGASGPAFKSSPQMPTSEPIPKAEATPDAIPERALAIDPAATPPAVIYQSAGEQPLAAPAARASELGNASLSGAHLNTADSSHYHPPQQPPYQPPYRPRPPHLPPQDPPHHPPLHQPDDERYPDIQDNGVTLVETAPVSTFSIDVDTAAYANTRRQLNAGQIPNPAAVRVEEFINYFNYSYPRPDGGQPFSITTEVGPSPWNQDRKLMLVGLQGYETDREELPPANLVFLIDVSGSMRSADKLGLLKASMKMLTRKLRPEDTISIAVYAGAAGAVLQPTSGDEKHKIMRAIDGLSAGGSTNGGAGINLAYSMARQAFEDEGINRVILATDGDFNVGVSHTAELGKLIEKKRKSGVALTVLGFGTGNYNDALMQELAQKGNGNAAYIDNINEARKVLVDEMGSTLETIAKDVKIQVEFNPATVSEYRLIGYETRALRREDFNNDAIDAGEIGAGHSVTALYELTLANADSRTVDDLRYQPKKQRALRPREISGELAHVKLRYKAPNGSKSKLTAKVVNSNDIQRRLQNTSDNFRFAAAASAFGQLLRESQHTRDFEFSDIVELARSARGRDPHGYRSEFEKLCSGGPRPPERLQHRAAAKRPRLI